MLKAVHLLAVAGVLVLWTGLAGESRSKAQDPGPAPAPPPSAPDVAKSVITLFDGRPVPEKWRLGFSIPLSAAKSTAGTRPESVRWYVEPAEFDAYCVRRDQGRSIDIQTGIEPVRLRVRLAVARGDTFDESTVEIQAGEKRPDPPAPPAPPPNPVDPPPGPQPPTPPDGAFTNPKIKAAAAEFFRGFGQDYAQAAARTRIAPQPYNDLVKQQAAAKQLRAKALSEAVDALVFPQVDDKTGLFRDKAAAAEALQGVADSLKAGMAEAIK